MKKKNGVFLLSFLFFSHECFNLKFGNVIKISSAISILRFSIFVERLLERSRRVSKL